MRLHAGSGGRALPAIEVAAKHSCAGFCARATVQRLWVEVRSSLDLALFPCITAGQRQRCSQGSWLICMHEAATGCARAQFNACSFGRMGSNSRQSSDGCDGGAAARTRGRTGALSRRRRGPRVRRRRHQGWTRPLWVRVRVTWAARAACMGARGPRGGGAHGGGPRLGLAALRFLVRALNLDPTLAVLRFVLRHHLARAVFLACCGSQRRMPLKQFAAAASCKLRLLKTVKAQEHAHLLAGQSLHDKCNATLLPYGLHNLASLRC